MIRREDRDAGTSADDDGPPPRLMSTPFWLALAFGLACVLAGLAVALGASRLWPKADVPPPPARRAALDAATAA